MLTIHISSFAYTRALIISEISFSLEKYKQVQEIRERQAISLKFIIT